MTTERAARRSFLKWCGGEDWDWLLALPIPTYPSPDEFNFFQWIREIERNDSTWAFRWVRFSSLGVMPAKMEWYALLGGLGSGEWRYWALRWAALNRASDLVGRKIWSARRGKPLEPVLKARFAGTPFRMDMQLGPESMAMEYHLKVDEDGLPFDPKLRKKLRGAVKPKVIARYRRYMYSRGSLFSPVFDSSRKDEQ